MNDADSKPMADAIYADKVRRARAAPKEQKMGWGPELFSEACVRMKEGYDAASAPAVRLLSLG